MPRTSRPKIVRTGSFDGGVDSLVRKTRFLVDVDDVLADLKTPLLVFLEETFGLKIRLEDLAVWDLLAEIDPKHRAQLEAEMATPGFCRHLALLPGAKEAIQEIQKYAEVYVVTSPFHSPTWAYDRVLWLQQYLQISMPTIVLTPAKYLVHGDFLLDDNPHNIEAWQAAHPEGQGLLWSIPNTEQLRQYDHFRVRSWDTVLERVKGFVPK